MYWSLRQSTLFEACCDTPINVTDILPHTEVHEVVKLVQGLLEHGYLYRFVFRNKANSLVPPLRKIERI